MHAEVKTIKERFLNNGWPQFLQSVRISGLRGWNGQEVRFHFPVVVVAGENGSGKSTVLKVAAAAYSHPQDRNLSFYPDTFFPDTAWDVISGVSLQYRVRLGDDEIDYALRKPTRRWRGFDKRPKRHVILQDISRTLPLDATVGYARIAKRAAEGPTQTTFDETFRMYYSSIMGRPYSKLRLSSSTIDSTKPVGVVEWGNQYSEFHQGAGEDATLDLMRVLIDVQKYSLIVIDEIEASLHPRAQRRLIHFLLWLARTKELQIILSSHSSFILEELPDEARIVLIRHQSDIQVLYGVSPNYALSRMDDYDRPDFYIFTEDQASSVVVMELLRYTGNDVGRFKCKEVGPSNVVEILGRLGASARLPYAAFGVLDADKRPGKGTVCLPGNTAPEVQVFRDILAGQSAALGMRLETKESSVLAALEKAVSLPDHHQWIQSAARELSQSQDYLWETMVKVWVSHCLSPEQVREFIQMINEAVVKLRST